MPKQPNDTSTSTVRQVLDHAITGIENLRLLLEETETLTHCAGLSLDALPWASSGSAQGYTQGYNQSPPPNPDDDFDLDDFDSIAYPDPGDISQRAIGKHDPEDRALALGRLQTLAIAASKASKRSLRYCQRLRHYLEHAMTRLDRGEIDRPRGVAEDPAGFSQPWLKSDDDPKPTR